MRPAPLRPAATVSTAAAQPQRYLTNDEAAEYLRLSPRTLEKQRVIGGGPRFRKFGRRVMYAVADLDAWAADLLHHAPRHWRIAQSALLQRWSSLHRLHHDPTRMTRCNFNITYPIGDLLFGSWKTEGRD